MNVGHQSASTRFRILACGMRHVVHRYPSSTLMSAVSKTLKIPTITLKCTNNYHDFVVRYMYMLSYFGYNPLALFSTVLLLTTYICTMYRCSKESTSPSHPLFPFIQDGLGLVTTPFVCVTAQHACVVWPFICLRDCATCLYDSVSCSLTVYRVHRVYSVHCTFVAVVDGVLSFFHDT